MGPPVSEASRRKWHGKDLGIEVPRNRKRHGTVGCPVQVGASRGKDLDMTGRTHGDVLVSPVNAKLSLEAPVCRAWKLHWIVVPGSGFRVRVPGPGSGSGFRVRVPGPGPGSALQIRVHETQSGMGRWDALRRRPGAGPRVRVAGPGCGSKAAIRSLLIFLAGCHETESGMGPWDALRRLGPHPNLVSESLICRSAGPGPGNKSGSGFGVRVSGPGSGSGCGVPDPGPRNGKRHGRVDALRRCPGAGPGIPNPGAAPARVCAIKIFGRVPRSGKRHGTVGGPRLSLASDFLGQGRVRRVLSGFQGLLDPFG